MKDAKRVCLVTGGAQGIGFAIAKRLVSDGFLVVLWDLNEGQLRDADTSLTNDGAEVLVARIDVSDESSVRIAMARVEERFGHLDAVVNSAGILGLVDGKPPSVEETPLTLWRRVLDVNLTGPFLVCREAIPLLRRRGTSSIVNIASTAARMRIGDPAYSTSKGALVTFSRYLAGDVAQHGIRVNCIAPSRVQTALTASLGDEFAIARKLAQTPLGRLGTVADMAGVASFLVSDDASFITGAVIDVNGGSYMQ